MAAPYSGTHARSIAGLCVGCGWGYGEHVTQPSTKRLGAGDIALAGELFLLMADAFEETRRPLSSAYLEPLLARADFWVIAAFLDGELVGGITAHTLPMTRAEHCELFIYDLAVRADRQRRGVGRQLVAALREQAAQEGIRDVFVPADNADDHALAFYRAIGGDASDVTFFTFSRP